MRVLLCNVSNIEFTHLHIVPGDIQEGLMLLSFVFAAMGIEFFQEKKPKKH